MSVPLDSEEARTSSDTGLSRHSRKAGAGLPMELEPGGDQDDEEQVYPTAKGVQQERPSSPVVSVVSMKSSHSIREPLDFKGEITQNTQVWQGGPSSPAASVLSMKSSQSIREPLDFKGEMTRNTWVWQDGPSTPAASVLSMKSSQSIREPLDFKGEMTRNTRKPWRKSRGIRQHRLSSLAVSALSMKSSHSIREPIDFKGEMTQNTQAQQDRPSSPVSMKSSQSIREPLDFRGEVTDNTHFTDSFAGPMDVPCDFCTEGNQRAVLSCLNCTASYCDFHIEDHYTVPALRKHTLVEVTGDLDQKLCQQHHRALELFCKTDQRFICTLCLVLDHEEHDVECSQPDGQVFVDVGDRAPGKHARPHPPGKMKVTAVKPNSAFLSWEAPEGLARPQKFRVTWRNDRKFCYLIVKDMCHVTIEDLKPGEEYLFTIVTVDEHDRQSPMVSASVRTVVPSPENVNVAVNETSASLTWSKPAGTDQVSFLVSCSGDEKLENISTKSLNCFISSLRPGTEYVISVFTVLNNGERSAPVIKSIYTKINLKSVLEDLGLGHHLVNKLTLYSVLEICEESSPKQCPQDWKAMTQCFLKRLMMVNSSVKELLNVVAKETLLDEASEANSCVDFIFKGCKNVNLLDVITGLFLCADPSLQLEMALKMSMCQIAVPLFLPSSDSQTCTVIAAAIRTLAWEFAPHFMSNKTCIEMNPAELPAIPVVSFVRLGKNSSSKSEILNRVFRNNRCHGDTFVHRNMTWGSTPRTISNGLAEISWYLPSGIPNSDILSEPVAVVNLRGDIRNFQTQFSALCQISVAVFVLCENLDWNVCLLNFENVESQLVIVSNSDAHSSNAERLQNQIQGFVKYPVDIIQRCQQMNDAQLAETLKSAVNSIIQKSTVTRSLKHLFSVTSQLKICCTAESDISTIRRKTRILRPSRKPTENSLVSGASRLATAITKQVLDAASLDEELPLQGALWRKLTKLQKEECRLRKAGDKNLEIYLSELSVKEEKLRQQQSVCGKSQLMSELISHLNNCSEACYYLLKSLKPILNVLRKQYAPDLGAVNKRQYQSSAKVEEVTDLSQQISRRSLGVEHFIREIGQYYELYAFNESINPYYVGNMPYIFSRLIMHGYPVELVDGLTSNVPLSLTEEMLKVQRVGFIKKIKVVSVLGPPSSGKSTLLNAMFGAQFSVASGGCTKGAFMTIIVVREDFIERLGCDHILVIDTEGLKEPKQAQMSDDDERDLELATMVVGLSDITIVNVSTENMVAIDNALQIVSRAFLRVNAVGKKPCCKIAYQNVNTATHEQMIQSRNLLLQQLNEMTAVASSVEKTDGTVKFTDIAEYNPAEDNWYLPDPDCGGPPITPASANYCETVSKLKTNIIETLKSKGPAQTITDFYMWMRSLWQALKYENFILSFRSCLVDEAFSKLCLEFNGWEWAFQKHMCGWLTEAENTVSNFDKTTLSPLQESDLDALLNQLKKQAFNEINKAAKTFLNEISNYFQRPNVNANLLEVCKANFVRNAENCKTETEKSIAKTLEAAVGVKKHTLSKHNIERSNEGVTEEKISQLLVNLEVQNPLNDQELEDKFEEMWDSAMKELSFLSPEKQNVALDVRAALWSNLDQGGGSRHEILEKTTSLEDCGKGEFKVDLDVKRHFLDLFKKSKPSQETSNSLRTEMQSMADKTILNCKQFVEEKLASKTDYQSAYTRELLEIIDEALEKHKHQQISSDFATSLKMYICGYAIREFKKMRDRFICDHDPLQSLEKHKPQYLADFRDLFYKRDISEKKAEEFTYLCVAPAVRDYINKALGVSIVDVIFSKHEIIDFRSRSSFGFSILRQLLTEDFEAFRKYVGDHENFVYEAVNHHVVKHFSNKGQSLSKIALRYLKVITQKIEEAMEKARNEGSEVEGGVNHLDNCTFIQNFQRELSPMLVIPNNTTLLRSASVKTKAFSKCLMRSIEDMKTQLITELQRDQDRNIRSTLDGLPLRPVEMLFDRVFRCKAQCPFCKAPCEADGTNHTVHFTAMHRPTGFGGFTDEAGRLCTEICSTLVASEKKFQTNGIHHPYKDYQKYYGDWRIQPDTNTKASHYWKYLFVKYQEEYAKVINAKPADLPSDWSSITEKQALESLQKAYNFASSSR